MGGIGAAWMIGSTGLQPLRVQKALLRESREMLDVLQAMFPTMLYNFVDARNDCAIRWLKWLGFTFDDPIPMGRGKHPFFPFYRQGRC
jgi:hypothetical protein